MTQKNRYMYYKQLEKIRHRASTLCEQRLRFDTWKSAEFWMRFLPRYHLMVGVGCPITRQSNLAISPSAPSMSFSSCVNLGGTTSPGIGVDPASLSSLSATGCTKHSPFTFGRLASYTQQLRSMVWRSG